MNLKIKKKESRELFKKGKFFPFILKYPAAVIVPIILLFIFSFNMFKEEVSFGRFFSFNNQERLMVFLRFPAGSDFKDIQAEIGKFEKAAMAKTYKKEIDTQIMERQAVMNITFPEEVEATAYPLQLKQEMVGMATNLAGLLVYIEGFDQEPYFYNPDTGTNLPYNIQIKGYSFDKLLEVAGQLKKNLQAHKRIKDVEIQTDTQFFRQGKEKYYAIKLDRDKLRHYSLAPNHLMFLIQLNLRESVNPIKLKFNDRELSLEVKSEDVENLELDDILDMNLATPTGTPFRLRDVVNIEFTVQRGGLARENQEYIAIVQWDYMGSAKAADRYHKTVYKNLHVPVGFTKSLEENRGLMSQEEESQLNFAIVLSIFLIYLILGMLYENIFQPLLIMLAIPLAMIGVFLGFVFSGFSFDSAAYIGVILLSGIVVNNAILLIDNINHQLKRVPRIVEAITIGTKERIRPIFMTSLTTVLGMLPLVLLRDGGGRGDIWSTWRSAPSAV